MGKSTGKPGTLKLDARAEQSSSSTTSHGNQDSASLQSGDVVIAAATASGGSVSKVYQHWADGDSQPADWNNNILSDQKSNYFEGEVIPHVFVYKASNNTPLVNGQTYSFNITYNYYQENTNAGGFAFITDYDTSRDPGIHPDLSGIEPVEDGSFINGGGMQGSFNTVDANITNVSDVTYIGTGTLDGYVTVTFVYTGTTTTSGFAEIYYGLYIAEPGQVPDQGSGTTDGASAWTGGSLQTTVDIGGSGATSIQLAPPAIIAGEISGMKFSDINGDAIRDADGVDNIAGNADDEVGLSGWTIFLDTDNDGVLDAGEISTVTDSNGAYTFSVTPDADKTDGQLDNDPYIVREVQQAGWTQTTANPAPILITADDPTETNVNFGNQPPLPDIDIVKSVVGNPIIDSVGDVIDFTVDVSNPGNVALSGVVVTDVIEDTSNPGGTKSLTVTELTAGGFNTGDTDQDDLLDNGEIWHYTVAYTITQDDFDNGVLSDGVEGLTNVATVDSDQTGPESDDAVVPVLFAQFPEITLVKEGFFTDDDGDGIDEATDGDGFAQAGELIAYTFSVTNTGNVTLTGATVNDPLITVSGSPIASMAPGDVDSTTFTGSYAITQADIDAGHFYNLATVTAADPDSNPVTDDDDHDEPLPQNPALNITKDATVPGGTADVAGEQISYTISVANVGNIALTGVTVADPYADAGSIVRGVDAVGDNDALLEVGETWSYTAAHTVTQEEIDSNGGGDGQLENTATADSNETGPDTDDASVPVAALPSLNITKDATVPGGTADAAGELISYTISVQNTGNTTLTGITVSDPYADAGSIVRGVDAVGDNDALLEVGETWSYTAAHTVTQAEIDSNGGGDGQLENTATADSNETGPDSDDASVPVAALASLNITKDASVPGGTADAAGELISYTISVQNTGNTTLTGITVSDPYADAGSIVRGVDAVGDNDALLEVGETWSYTAAHTVTQAEIDSNGGGDGQLENTATADSNETGPDSDDASVPVAALPSLNITKDASVPGGTADAAGELISYTISVQNTGNTTLTGVTVSDPYADAGSIVRGVDAVGDNDALLEVGETWSYTAAHTVTQAEIDSNGGGDGQLENTATADSNETGPDTDDASVPVAPLPSLNITKDATVPGGTADAAGELISYTISVQNTGNTTLTGVTVSDPYADAGSIVRGVDAVGDNDALLEVGETWSYTAAHTVTQAEIDSNGGGDGQLENTATADSNETGPDTDDASVPVAPLPSLNITKDATVPGGTADAAGELISYTISVANTGNTTLTGVTVSDPYADAGSIVRGVDAVGDNDALLEVGETWSYTAAHTVTQEEIDSNGGGDGQLENTATADSNETGPDTDDASVPVAALPSLNITKDATVPGGTADAAGELISYTISVQNTGNTTLTGVTVSDPYADAGSIVRGVDAVGDNDALLEVGETWSYTAAHTVTQEEIDSNGGGDGQLENTATADSNETGPDTDDASVPVEQNPALNITKDASVPGGTANVAGELISYTISVANIGNIALTGVTVADPYADAGSLVRGLDSVGDNDAILEVGETWSYTAAHTVTQEEIDNNGGGDGVLENTATADSNETGPDTDDASVPLEQSPALTIDKTVTDVGGDGPGGTVDEAGDIISYQIVVDNTGNMTLTGVTVSDQVEAYGVDALSNPTGDTDNDGALDVNETWTYTASYTVTQDDIDNNGGGDGFINNVAIVDTDQTPPEDDDEDVPLLQNPALTIDKTVTDVGGDGPGGTVDEAGDIISYQIVVDNTGNMTLTSVTVSDQVEAYGVDALSNPTGDTDNDGALDVDETWTYTASYTVTQADLDNNGGGDGFINNVAIVDTDQTPPDDDDEFVPLLQDPLINIEKITVAGLQSGDGLTGVQAGTAISWEYTVTNIGNVTLDNVVVTDDAGTPGNTADDFTATYTGGDDGNGLLDVGEVWTYSAQGTAIVGQYSNLGTVTAYETDGDPDPVTDTDPSSYVGVGDYGLIAPTGTSCHDYINGTAQSFQEYYAYQGGVAQYGVKNGDISQTNPGVFFYYTGLSGSIVGADGGDDGSAVDPLTIMVDQSDDSSVVGAFDVLNKNNVMLFKIEDVNENGIIDAGDECVRVRLDADQISIVDGDVTVNFTPDEVGSMYVLSVKYTTNNLVGTDLGGDRPTVHYDFETYVDGTFAETDSGGLDFAPKSQFTTTTADPVQLIGSTEPTSADMFMS